MFVKGFYGQNKRRAIDIYRFRGWILADNNRRSSEGVKSPGRLSGPGLFRSVSPT